MQYINYNNRQIPYEFEEGTIHVYVKGFINSYPNDTDVTLDIRGGSNLLLTLA